MSSQLPSHYGDRRPTLPPIRDILGAELSQSVSAQSSSRHSSASSSPHIPFQRLTISDDGSQVQHAASSRHGIPTARSYAAYPDGRPASPAMQMRTSSDSAHRPASQMGPQQYSSYGHHSSIMPRHIDPSALATSGYPYAASQPLPPYTPQNPQSMSSTRGSDSASVERPTTASGRYECNWCGKGFTRPSSLKIHMNTHTGEKPYVCPFEGCGRSFSVQSNMRRHSRVHTKNTDAQVEPDDDESDAEDSAAASRNASHSRGDSGSSTSRSGQSYNSRRS